MVLMGRKLPFKILGLSDLVVAQKSLIFIFVRVIISPEKNPRKPVSILRAEIRDFKLLVTDSRGAAGKVVRAAWRLLINPNFGSCGQQTLVCHILVTIH